MVTTTEVCLKNFFIFNSKLSAKEGEELRKILYYYPSTESFEAQIKNVGLVEAIIQFTGTFKPSSPVKSVHTQKLRQLYFQPEKDYWMVMTLHLPSATRPKDGLNNAEQHLEDDVQDNVYDALLKQSYNMFRMLKNSFCNAKDINSLKMHLESFYNNYLKTMRINSADILTLFNGIQYLPLDTLAFLKVQCFVNSIESINKDICHTAFMYNEHIIWSGLEPSQMQTVYQYLIESVLSGIEDADQQGISSRTSPFATLPHGRFLTGPTNLKLAKTIGEIPKVYLFANDTPEDYHLIVYRLLSVTVCLFIKGSSRLTLDSFRELDVLMGPKLISITSDIDEYCTRQQQSPCGLSDTSPKFIYFNKLNLAYKSTLHLDKHSGNLACQKESLRIMADMKSKNHLLGHCGETIVKTMNDYWVVSKTSNSREFFIALQQRNASLIDISEEVQRLCTSELKGIFFHPM